MDEDDHLVGVLPIHYSNTISPSIQIHQFPLLARHLQVPPSQIKSGKRIRARIKPVSRRLEVHVPVDTRPEYWNSERAKELGAARVEDDREKNQESKGKEREDEEPRLTEVRMRSEEMPQRGVHMLGIVRDGKLHLHPISEMHQFRPTLTYLDILTRKKKHSRAGGGSESDSDDGPPPDPDEAAPMPLPKKEKKSSGEVREVQVSARKSEEKGIQPVLGGLSAVRREMLLAIRNEDDESWQDLEFCETTRAESRDTFEAIFSQNGEELQCKTDVTVFINDISGL